MGDTSNNNNSRPTTWVKEKAEIDYIWRTGNVYPHEVVCTAYEVNTLGEKRFVERKTFKLVEVGKL